MAHVTIDRKTAARGRRVLAAILLVAVLAVGALARSRSRDTAPGDPAPTTTSGARIFLADDGAWSRLAGPWP